MTKEHIGQLKVCNKTFVFTQVMSSHGFSDQKGSVLPLFHLFLCYPKFLSNS